MAEWDAGKVLAALRGKMEPDGTLSDEASGELRRIRRAMERQHRAIEESLRKSLRALAAEGSAQDELITVRGERFVIPVKAEFRRRVPGVVHGASSSGQTVFVEPLETIEENNELQRLLDEEQREVRRILVAMTRAVGAEAEAIAAGTAVLAEVEAHFARAKFAEELGCVRPSFGGEGNDGDSVEGEGVVRFAQVPSVAKATLEERVVMARLKPRPFKAAAMSAASDESGGLPLKPRPFEATAFSAASDESGGLPLKPRPFEAAAICSSL